MSEEDLWKSVVGATIIKTDERRNDWTGANEVSILIKTASGQELTIWAQGGLAIEEPDLPETPATCDGI